MKLFVALVVLLGSITGVVSAQELRFEFTIDAQINGARDWDYTGPSSSALDDLDVGSALLGDGLLGSAADVVLGTAIDETADGLQEEFAPPDPYLCIIAIRGSLPELLSREGYDNRDFQASCTQRSDIRPNNIHFNLTLPPQLSRREIFGLALADSDARNFLTDGGRFVDADDGDELIGFGLFVNDQVRDQIQQRDPEALRLVAAYETQLPAVMNQMFRFNAGPDLEMEKISVFRCGSGCRFGHATVVIKDTVGGW